MKYKTAIIIPGGGMACAYFAGVLNGLVDKYDLIKPDIIIGSSGSAGTVAYYVAGQYDSIKNIWTNLSSSNKLINFFRLNKIIDIDYLIDEVFKKKDILDTKRVYSSKIDFFIATTKCDDASIRFFSKKDKNHDLFDILRAAKALPIVYRKKIPIGKEQFFDTYVSATYKPLLKKAISLGANKIIVMERSSPWYGRIISNVWLLFQNNIFKNNYYKSLNNNRNLEIPSEVDVFYIKPEFNMFTLNNNSDSLKTFYDKGYKRVFSDKKMESFLKI